MACPTTTPGHTVLFEDYIVRWTIWGDGTVPRMHSQRWSLFESKSLPCVHLTTSMSASALPSDPPVVTHTWRAVVQMHNDSQVCAGGALDTRAVPCGNQSALDPGRPFILEALGK